MANPPIPVDAAVRRIPSNRRPKVFAVTVGTNERRWLDACFSSLAASVLPNVELHLVYVDNASSDGSCEFVRSEHPRVRVIRNSWNAGFAGANNVGIQHALEAGADYVFLVNPDTRTPPELVRQLVEFMDAWPEYGVTGPQQLRYKDNDTDASELNDWSRGAIEAGERHVFYHTWPQGESEAGPMAGRAPATLEHAYVQGSAFFCRADVLRRVGMFDPAYHTYYEETDLCRRARWAGWRVALLLDLTIEHYGGGGTRASSYRRLRMLRNKYYYLLTDPTWPIWDAYRLALRWIGLDLRCRGAAPAESSGTALLDLTRGLLWCAAMTPRAVAIRSANRTLLRNGGNGPLSKTSAQSDTRTRGTQWHTA